MRNPTDHPDDAGTPKLAFGLLAKPRRVIAGITEPSNRTMQALWLVAIVIGLIFWAYTGSAAAGILMAALLAGPLHLARRWRIRRMVADLHARLVKLIKSGEYEADVAQDRRLWWRVLRTGNWAALFTWTMREDARTRVRPGKYVRLDVLGGGVWPTRAHVAAVTIRWAPFVLISKDDVKRDILAQVAGWWDVEVTAPGGWDTPRCRVTLVPKEASHLPASAPYPGSGPGEAEEPTREDTGRSTGRPAPYDPGKPRWSNWDGGE